MLTEAPETRPDRRAQGHHRQRLVCRPPERNGRMYKLYAESFKGQAHLLRIQEDAQALIKQVFSSAGA